VMVQGTRPATWTAGKRKVHGKYKERENTAAITKTPFDCAQDRRKYENTKLEGFIEQ